MYGIELVYLKDSKGSISREASKYDDHLFLWVRVDIRISPILLARQPNRAPEGTLHGRANQLHNCAIAKSQAHTVVLECACTKELIFASMNEDPPSQGPYFLGICVRSGTFP